MKSITLKNYVITKRLSYNQSFIKLVENWVSSPPRRKLWSRIYLWSMIERLLWIARTRHLIVRSTWSLHMNRWSTCNSIIHLVWKSGLLSARHRWLSVLIFRCHYFTLIWYNLCISVPEVLDLWVKSGWLSLGSTCIVSKVIGWCSISSTLGNLILTLTTWSLRSNLPCFAKRIILTLKLKVLLACLSTNVRWWVLCNSWLKIVLKLYSILSFIFVVTACSDMKISVLLLVPSKFDRIQVLQLVWLLVDLPFLAVVSVSTFICLALSSIGRFNLVVM